MSHPIHPMIVHFPIALLFTSVFFDLLAMITQREAFRQTGFSLLILGWVGGLAATLTGFWSEEAVEKMGVPEAAIEKHETFAIATMIVFAVLFLIRWRRRARPSPRKNAVYAAVALVGLALLATAGFFGGDLVYRYGAGVQSQKPEVVHILPPAASRG